MKNNKTPYERLMDGEDPFEGLSKKEKEELLRVTEERFKQTTKKVFLGRYTKRRYEK